ncbi:ABC transporter substrate-binding protein [Micromonospora sp. DT47]|uniref:ABC transporter substrate-binding protein n=1 Tax=Micromonospora sp. DT47 TaxID=3393431 RepID=UPI003CFA5262
MAGATALLLGLSGCAGSGGSDSSGERETGKVEGKLRVVTNWTGGEGEAFAAVIDGFKAKHPTVEVQIEQVPFAQGEALLTQQFAQGSPPDVAVALPGMIRAFSQQGLLLNLDQMWDRWIADGQYTPTLREVAAGAEGRTEAVYFKGNINALIWYNPAQLAKLGVSVPKTWAEFTAVLDKAKAAGLAPFAVGGKDTWPLTQWTDPVILRVAGPDAFNDLARGKIGWDDPRIVKSFEVLADMIGKYFPDNALSAGFIDSTCGRVQGKFLFENQGAFINLVDPAECDKSLEPGKDLAFFLMPPYDNTVPPAQFVSGDLFVGAKDTKNLPATRALLEYLGSVDAQTIWAKRGGYVAPNTKVPTSVYPDVNDQQAATLWPKDSSVKAGYDLDDWIGGEIQVKYRQALSEFVRDQDVDGFISTMKRVDDGSRN